MQRTGLKRDLDHLIATYPDRPISEWGACQALNDMMTIAFRHQLQLPTDLVLLVRVIAMSEGLGMQLDPVFELLEFAEPYLRRFWLRRYVPDYLTRKLAQGMLDLPDLALLLPQDGRRLLGQLERGDLVITARNADLDQLLDPVERVGNRLAVSILTAALIIGLGLLMLVYHPPGWAAWGGWFFGLVFLAALLMGRVLLWSIWRSR